MSTRTTRRIDCDETSWINALTDVITVHPLHGPTVEAMPHATPTASVHTAIWWTPSVGP